MWRDVTRWLPTFDSAVVVWRDADGYPSSLRCHPAPDTGRRALAIELPPGFSPQPGPAGLLCHAHDRNLWQLRSFHVNGELQVDGTTCWFVPRRFIPGLGLGVSGQLRSAISAGLASRTYRRRRGLKATAVDWAEIDAARHEGAAIFDAVRRAQRG